MSSSTVCCRSERLGGKSGEYVPGGQGTSEKKGWGGEWEGRELLVLNSLRVAAPHDTEMPWFGDAFKVRGPLGCVQHLMLAWLSSHNTRVFLAEHLDFEIAHSISAL